MWCIKNKVLKTNNDMRKAHINWGSGDKLTILEMAKLGLNLRPLAPHASALIAKAQGSI
jgi:hypothetical protein